jgi:hypothetical protein
LGYILCVDSMHSKSQARFNPENWHDATVIIDEAEQVLWHMLNSKTEIKKHRVEVLQNFQTVIRNILNSTQGRVVLADADLSNRALDYIQKIGYGDTASVAAAGVGNFEPVAHPQTYIVNNKYVAPQRTVHLYEGNNPGELLHDLYRAIERGEKVMIHLTGQKSSSRWGSQVLEMCLNARFPDRRQLRIDSQTVLDKDHPAFGCMEHLNPILLDYDIVIATSCLETGVSIDILGHFNSVWGIFQGVHTCDSVRQALARVRDNIPRHIFVSKQGMPFSRIGNGGTSVKSLMQSTDIIFNANFKLLSNAGLNIFGSKKTSNKDNNSLSESEELGLSASLKLWAQKASIINAEYFAYQQTVVEGLEKEGYKVEGKANFVEKEIYLGDVPCIQDVIKEVKAACNQIHEIYSQEVAECDDISSSEYEKMKSKKMKTKEEHQKQYKYELKLRYGIDVTPHLVDKDDKAWYPKIQLVYYLTVGKDYLPQHDIKKASEQLAEGNGKLFKPDFNDSQLTSGVQLLSALGILKILEKPGAYYNRYSPEMLELEALAKQHRNIIKNYLNVNIGEKMTPIALAQALLAKLGVKLTMVGKVGGRGKQLRIYTYVRADDGRDTVFAAWLKRDESLHGKLQPLAASTSHP